MSGPYVYKPAVPVQQYPQFQNAPYYVNTPQPTTPFIPDSALYPTTPYSNPASLPASLPTTPNHRPGALPASAPNQYAFPATAPTTGWNTGYPAAWDGFQRERRPSWHGQNPGHFLQPTPPYAEGYPRRHSFGVASGGYTPAQFQGYIPHVPPTPSAFYLHPWINGEAPRSDFFFDLARPFAPQRQYGPGQFGPLSAPELMEAATHPPITQLRIQCDAIPQWPIELRLDPYVQTQVYSELNPPPPISLQDVFIAVHRSLQKQIAHVDWDQLSHAQEYEIAKAFTQRCRAIPGQFEHERSQGVKRVDYLLGKTRMAGLMRVGMADGWQVMKLITVAPGP
ncbi:hypothetical protein H0H81_005750 [Sphagnurus paluster]|uniref:DUF6699 domain-containing protein n=1 Tax=Sphagnurus paluster TaxID=117069 RepID=A0A9P7FRB7_9AGAR|nr:hypothetical protein H0H81_005750 [Sphagnurus paluster]